MSRIIAIKTGAEEMFGDTVVAKLIAVLVCMIKAALMERPTS